VGLKRRRAPTDVVVGWGSNRTIVGLKPASMKGELPKRLGSNRTIVGLKLFLPEEEATPELAAIAPLWD